MDDLDDSSLQVDLAPEEARQDIARAVSARSSIAHRYVVRLRRRHPDATPQDVVRMLERHYAGAITASGIAIEAGSIAAQVGIGLLPGGGAAATGMKAAGKQVAKKTTKEIAKAAAKSAAVTATKGGVARLIPAGDQQLQFEITALFALALADIHGIAYDKEQAQALVFGLTNERVSQQQVSQMAKDVALASGAGGDASTQVVAPVGSTHWATTLGGALPGGAAQTFVRTMQTGQLDAVRDSLTAKQRATIDYGVGAVSGGITRFVFGREVIVAAQGAFPPSPDQFPAHLALEPGDLDDPSEPNRALQALETAAKSAGVRVTKASSVVGAGVTAGASVVGSGVVSAAGRATRVFRSVDLNGDGQSDEARARTAAKAVGGAVRDAGARASRRVRKKPKED